MAKEKSKKESKTTVARQDNGNIQITFTIEWKEIKKNKLKTLEELTETVEVKGFRKGKAPINEVEKQIPAEQLTEKTLAKILPGLFSDLIAKENLRPAIYPKFELVKATDGEDWQVRALTCELPEVDVKNYKDIVTKIKVAKKATKEENEAKIMETLVKTYETDIPEILIEEEVNSRLSSMLERLEKLGLSLESYLASLNKTAPQLREEYGDQAKKAILLDIILQNIGIESKVKVTEEEINSYIKVSGVSENQKNTVRLFLKKRKTLDNLAKLV